jgi:hypothetical protein
MAPVKHEGIVPVFAASARMVGQQEVMKGLILATTGQCGSTAPTWTRRAHARAPVRARAWGAHDRVATGGRGDLRWQTEVVVMIVVCRLKVVPVRSSA